MEIIDNYLAPDLFNVIRDNLLISQNIPWFLQTDASGQGVEKYPYFTHLMHSNHKSNSNHFDQNIVPILFMFGANALIRVKVNMYPRTETLYHYHDHTDYEFPHKAAILYLNTNDGYTIIGDTKVESIANRLLKFDATQMHHSTTCTDQQYRANINFNYF
tara:strand:+ start:681 stop:1160 length:480 start_codon:yes stop_codon:yes gene_type:complete